MSKWHFSILPLLFLCYASCKSSSGGSNNGGQNESPEEPRTPSTYSLSGSVTGLSGRLVVSSQSETITLTSNGAFSFPTRLASNSRYSIAIVSEPGNQRCRVTQSTGTVEATGAFSIQCTDKTWTIPSNLSEHFNPGGTNNFLITPKAFVDNDYNATIAFSQPAPGGGLHQVFKSELRADAWSHPASSNAHLDIRGKRGGATWISGNQQGDLLITWSGWDSTALCGMGVPCYQTFKAEYRNGSWTGIPLRDAEDNISPNAEDVLYPNSAMSSSGDAIIVWSQSNGTTKEIFKSEYRNGTWNHPSSLSDHISPLEGDASTPRVVMNGTGDAIIVWQEGFHIYKSEFRHGNWTHPANANDYIDPTASTSSNPAVAINDSGDAIIVWRQTDSDGKPQLAMSQYRNGSWNHPAHNDDNISPDGKFVWEPKVALSENGEAVIAWRQYDSSDKLQVFVSEYRAGAWNHPTDLSDNISPDGASAGDTMTYYPQLSVSMDKIGNTVLAWRQSDGSKQQLFKSTFWNGSWTHPADLSDNISPNGKDCYSVETAMGNPGITLILWSQRDNDDYIQAYKAEYR